MNVQVDKKVAIMQPYFFPYIGYFQLINSVDTFVVYDNIKYTKKGWINRNRFLNNSADMVFSLPLKKASDALDIRDRELAVDFNARKLLNQLHAAYRKAPHAASVMELVESVLCQKDHELFAFLRTSIEMTCQFLHISTPLVISSTIDINHELQAQDKVLALCKAEGASVYINPIGGLDLYSKQVFSDAGIELKFLQSRLVEYPQFGHPFVPWLSIIDLMMFNSVNKISEQLAGGYDLV